MACHNAHLLLTLMINGSGPALITWNMTTAESLLQRPLCRTAGRQKLRVAAWSQASPSDFTASPIGEALTKVRFETQFIISELRQIITQWDGVNRRVLVLQTFWYPLPPDCLIYYWRFFLTSYTDTFEVKLLTYKNPSVTFSNYSARMNFLWSTGFIKIYWDAAPPHPKTQELNIVKLLQ